jgi:hypothetical protein
VLIPAFMISELRRAFEIGFLIALPFLVIDMIVATLTMSMGMMMLPPTVISVLVVVPAEFMRLPSPDNDTHVCVYRVGSGEYRPRCVFVPGVI